MKLSAIMCLTKGRSSESISKVGKTPFLLSVDSMVGKYKVYDYLSGHPTSISGVPDIRVLGGVTFPYWGNGAGKLPADQIG